MEPRKVLGATPPSSGSSWLFPVLLIGAIGTAGYFLLKGEGGGSDEFSGANRLYDRALPEVGKKRALDQVRGYLGVPDNASTNAAFSKWRRTRGV